MAKPTEKTKADEDGPRSMAPSLAPYLFVILECGRPLARGLRLFLGDVDEVHIGRGAERSFERVVRDGLRLLLLSIPDPRMSSTHARIIREETAFRFEDRGSTNGTLVNGARIESALVTDDDVLEIGSTLLAVRKHLTLGEPTDFDASARRRAPGLTTLVPAHSDALAAFVKIAPSGLSVLLLGESGTGKEVLARAVHGISMRSGAFVPVNCGALPETLVEGQLFGHVRGAFSGADRDEPGLVRASDRGTLFLDEIGDLPRTSQAALLRVLQEREVMAVGSTRPIPVDLRVVAATHRPVDTLGADSGFRADLYARLAGFTHRLPPLRERREDLGLLVADLLASIAPDRAAGLTLAPPLGRALLRYSFPLNVRELYQCLSVAVVLATRDVLELKHAPDPIRNVLGPLRSSTPAPFSAPSPPSSDPPLSEEDERTRTSLLAALGDHRGNVSEVARALGRTRMQIHRWMKRFDIDVETFRR